MDSTFKIQVNDLETGEYVTTHILDGNDLDEIALMEWNDVLTVEEIDLENFEY